MKTLVICYVALVVLTVSACQKSNQDATVPAMSTDCVNNPSLCNPNLYQQSPGFTPYNYNGNNIYGGGYYNGGFNAGFGGYYGGSYNPFVFGNNTSYLCNCPNGSVPTYNNYAGLGCVQSTQVYGYFYASFGFGTNNNQWTNIPQISNTVGYGNRGCYNGVVQSCLVDDPSTCTVGFSCRSNSASSRLGICISNNANQNAGQILR